MGLNQQALRAKLGSLLLAGLPRPDLDTWIESWPSIRNDFAADSEACSSFWSSAAALRARLPTKPARNTDQSTAAALIHRAERDLRDLFLNSHAEVLYDNLTASRAKFLRIDELVAQAADAVPGLVPDANAMAVERALLLKDKDGLEIDHGLLLSHLLSRPKCGRHLCHAMLLPRAETSELLPRLLKEGSVDLGTAVISTAGKVSVVELRNPKTLNALDETTLAPLEIATDLAILAETTEIAVLRGGRVEHPKYAGRRICSAGINLTHLYQGKIPFLFYFQHAMGYEHKMVRGVAREDASPLDIAGSTIEKPWIGVVETFAIGGGCQLLLAMDYVLAQSSAYLSLPARKEGIIPAMANLRLPRFLGDRLARKAIMLGGRIDCDSPTGRMICDEVVADGEIDEALTALIHGLTDSGIVSAVGNRRQFRIGLEPLDLFREYLALLAKEQADCHFGSGLISNLERNWNAQFR
jgi:(3,5-dihydroxyphenyl)acetyl-CoA 1,2-dioxygenase